MSKCPKCEQFITAFRTMRCSFCGTCEKCSEHLIGGQIGWICSECAVALAQLLFEKGDQTFCGQFTHTDKGRQIHRKSLEDELALRRISMGAEASSWDRDREKALVALIIDKLS